jgi:siroheme synthase
VPFEVVPGVSALSAVPAAAGIPITFRGLAREVVVRSGYRQEEPSVTTRGPDGGSETTYLYLMTVGRLTEIVEELLAEGVDPSTPAAIVQRGTLPDQQLVESTLGELVTRTARAGLKPPAMVIVGEVVRFLNWKENLPLLEAQLVGGTKRLGE